MKDISKKSQ